MNGMFGSLIQHMQVKVKGALPASWVRQKCLLSARNMEKHLKRVEAEACWKREKNMFEVEILQEACVETLGPFRLANSFQAECRMGSHEAGMVHLH